MSVLKLKYIKKRREFKRELYIAMTENKALAMLAIETYTAYKHRRHIGKIWELLGFYHKEAYKDYCDKLGGKHLSGDESIWRALYFAEYKHLYNYSNSIPERYAMGDAVSVAYKVLKRS